MQRMREVVRPDGGWLKGIWASALAVVQSGCSTDAIMRQPAMPRVEADQAAGVKKAGGIAGYAIRDNRAKVRKDALPVIAILDNDLLGSSEWVLVEVVSGPIHGTAMITEERKLEYRPDPGYVGIDQLVYRVTHQYNQATGAAHIGIRIDCVKSCLRGVRLEWTASTGSEGVVFILVMPPHGQPCEVVVG